MTLENKETDELTSLAIIVRECFRSFLFSKTGKIWTVDISDIKGWDFYLLCSLGDLEIRTGYIYWGKSTYILDQIVMQSALVAEGYKRVQRKNTI